MPLIVPATTLTPGKRVQIVSVSVSDFEAKLLAMGVLPGKTIELVRKSPFGGAWYVKIDGQSMALRVNEAQTILIH